MDLRNRGEGGWFYAENELFSVFAPLIGPDGIAVYMAMCRLVPLAGVSEERPVTMRAIEAASCVSRGQVNRKVAEIVALGMVLEMKHARNRPSTYKLPELRNLALLGEAELKARLGVPRGDTGSKEGLSTMAHSPVSNDASSRAQSGLSHVANDKTVANGPASPAASGENGVPRWDTEAADPAALDFDKPVSQNRASVSQKQPSVSQNRASVSQIGGLLKEEEEEEEDKYPPTPVPGDGGSELILPVENCTPDAAEFPASIAIAAHWTMQKLGLSKRRLQDTIAAALVLWCRQNDKSLQAAAQLAVANYTKYIADVPVMRWGPWGPENFFAKGYWSNPSAWPYDQAKVRAAAEAAVGMRKAAARESDAEYRARVDEFIGGNITFLTEIGGLDDIVAKLQALPADMDLLDLEIALDDIDDEMVQAAWARSDPEIAATRQVVETEISKEKGTPTAAVERLRFQIFASRLYGKHQFPRLTLRCLPRKT
ncbi:MAG TPA: hypothetical protein VFC39_21850 [Acidobacteriaceae bacterium]|nr:hypothetical protein [Acidobacteriaceae bacterium]